MATPAPRPRAYLTFLLVTRPAAWLWLCRREESWKNAETLLLRHQLAVLRRQPGARPKPSWADRALIAALLGVIPRARRASLRMIVTPDTVLRWHRDIVRRRWAAKSRRKQPRAPGDPPQRLQPGASSGLRESGVGLPQLCRAPHSRRIPGELAGLGVKVAASNVWEILKASGVDPAPLRRTGPAWQQFLCSQAGAILACDFFSVDLPGNPGPASWP